MEGMGVAIMSQSTDAMNWYLKVCNGWGTVDGGAEDDSDGTHAHWRSSASSETLVGYLHKHKTVFP